MRPTSATGSAHGTLLTRTEVERPGNRRLRPVIEASWHRSSACGLSHEMKAELPYTDDFDDDSRLLRAARPVLDRLETSLSGTSTSVLLADAEARILERWVGEKSLHDALDRAHVAPGFGFAEEFAGTNGVGTALEDAVPVTVRGEEHYADFLRHLACVGVPIRHPTTGAVEGILDISCLAAEYNPLMPPLILEAVRHIETRLTQMSSQSEVALLEAFARACRRHRGAVVAISPNMIFTNPPAVKHLIPTDQAILWDAARTTVSSGRSEATVDLARGRFRMRCTPVSIGSGEPRGVVVRLDPCERSHESVERSGTVADTTPQAPKPGPPGHSAQWRQLLERVRQLADGTAPVAFSGEPGTGKHRLALYLHELAPMPRGLRVFDASTSPGETGQDEMLDRADAALACGDTVVIRRIDELAERPLARLRGLAVNGSTSGRARTPGRLLVTARRAGGDDALEFTLAAFPHHLWVPPLRRRSEDVTDIVPALLADLAPDRRMHCSLPAMQTLLDHPWPGNVAELRDALVAVVVSVGDAAREIQPQHLPTWVLKRAGRRRLSAIEEAQRNLIIETLASVGGNRSEAARILGIGRATLYRRMRSLGIATSHQLGA
ncbi:Transcriptional regulator of acetoin/glycerol metabolism [Pseudonocardia thermophila]|jgi:Transcriptional activator of acetoin/glycerol metabolism|uniref:Transcriptional regulator of acetoin/glycerol metabolism n=1 Tax=Pseudonocardia thermophila TaxID=1848 RepID=A0A1M6T2Z8_PSETH|nr:Transcriptional regulator of acetoin/glycerol metabolism [Pseudonocardia thermophila]